FVFFFFFFQAEDGIRDRTVTGVQTCALPISDTASAACRAAMTTFLLFGRITTCDAAVLSMEIPTFRERQQIDVNGDAGTHERQRSEERRVGKEGRARWGEEQYKRKTK